jgi:hypothetical protein
MIVAERKPIEEIKGFLAGHKRILVLGCGTCVTVCLAGGEREVTTLASVLRTGKEIRFRFWLSEDKAVKEAKRRPTGW